MTPRAGSSVFITFHLGGVYFRERICSQGSTNYFKEIRRQLGQKCLSSPYQQTSALKTKKHLALRTPFPKELGIEMSKIMSLFEVAQNLSGVTINPVSLKKPLVAS